MAVASRVNASIKNMIYGMVGLLINLIITFVAKSIFINMLGVAYNGINGLFSNILSILNLAELGFAGAVAFALYKPLSEGDELKTATIMNYFKKVYRIIALVVSIAGLCCLPILQFLIKEPLDTLPFAITEIRLYFLMYLANTSFSYLLAYKRTIITADQKSYIVSNVDNLANILLNILQIVLLLVTKNYYAFLAIMLAKTIINNFIIQIIADKKYKYLNRYKTHRLEKTERSAILKNVKAMMLHQIGTVAVFSTISIVISTFVGVIEAGKYGNYVMITNNVRMLINILFTSITASLGNLCATASEEVQFQIFKKVEYLTYFVAMFTFTCFVALLNPFIELWIGVENKFGMIVIIFISLQAYVSYLRQGIIAFKMAKGIFRADRYKPIAEAVVGIGLSIGLSYAWGVAGVILGYTLASLIIALPVEVYVVYKKGFQKPMLPHFIKQLVLTISTAVVAAFTYWLISLVAITGIGGFVIKFLIAISIPIIVYFSCTCWTKEFKYFITLIGQMFNVVRRKIRKNRNNIICDTGEKEKSSAIIETEELSATNEQSKIADDVTSLLNNDNSENNQQNLTDTYKNDNDKI